jgi:hypothetical protein
VAHTRALLLRGGSIRGWRWGGGNEKGRVRVCSATRMSGGGVVSQHFRGRQQEGSVRRDILEGGAAGGVAEHDGMALYDAYLSRQCQHGGSGGGPSPSEQHFGAEVSGVSVAHPLGCRKNRDLSTCRRQSEASTQYVPSWPSSRRLQRTSRLWHTLPSLRSSLKQHVQRRDAPSYVPHVGERKKK